MHNVGVAGKTLTKTGHIEAIREKIYIHWAIQNVRFLCRKRNHEQNQWTNYQLGQSK